jgi:murein DD-endopeptidase MepM/ murein hydrolase activator NlpD
MFQGNEKGKSRWARWKDQLKHTYRLVLMNNETFEEVGSYRLNLLNVYLLASTVLVVLAVLVFILIAFTPLKRYLPGYGEAIDPQEITALYQEIEELEEALIAQQNYTENFKKVLVGDVETAEDVELNVASAEVMADTMTEIKTTPVDSQMRREIELAEIGAIAQIGRNTNFSPRTKPLEQLFFVSPITGEVSAGFLPDEKHLGVDILAPKNTAIKAAMDGYVFISDWTLETGNTIGIQHANNLITFYKHNSVLLKKAGSFVKAGEAVAIIGNTGTLTDGPHLHFELWYKGKPVDPLDYISF